MTFHATIQLTLDIRHALQAETLTFNRGQWVQWPEGAKGRFLGNKGGVITILWRYKAESFSQFNQRFTRAVQGHKFTVSRPARSPLAESASSLSPVEQLQQDAFLYELVHVGTLEALADDALSLDADIYSVHPVSLVEGYRLLMQCSIALLLQSCVTGRKSIVLREVAVARSLNIYPMTGRYKHYPKGWGHVCH